MQKPYRGPKSIPNQVQLPGGIILKGLPFKIVEYNPDGTPKPFKIVEYNPDGTPKLFELQPPGPHDIKADGACVLFAHEDWIRSPMPGKARE